MIVTDGVTEKDTFRIGKGRAEIKLDTDEVILVMERMLEFLRNKLKDRQ